MTDVAALMVLAVWLYLTFARGAFWLVSMRDGRPVVAPPAWPAVVAIIPARDEERYVAESGRSPLQQSHPGALSVVLVDDQSRDQTAAAAVDAARSLSAAHRLEICRGGVLPAGW